jgi:prevent-host-death family protein
MPSTRPESIGVAELKRHFSDYLDRVQRQGQRVMVRRRGREVAALVPASDLPRESTSVGRGLVAAAGAWEDHGELDEFVRSVYRARSRARDRDVKLP